MYKNYKRWVNNRQLLKLYTTSSREPFYDIIKSYLPLSSEARIIDIGTGNGSFPFYLKLNKLYKNLILFDSNPESLKNINNHNTILYTLPNKLPLDDISIDFIHCSHVIEHLHFSDVYSSFIEIDRVLKKDGVVVFSGPIFSNGFYNDLTHVKPYNPSVFLNYFIQDKENQTLSVLPDDYLLLKLVTRYEQIKPNHTIGWKSDIIIIDFLIQIIKKIILKFKISRIVETGFTIILKKV